MRNLRNLRQAGVSEELVLAALAAMKTDRVLPFRFLAAARNAPAVGAAARGGDVPRARRLAPRSLPGHTVLLVDVSGSMEAPLSSRSEMRRTDAAYGLAILLREIAEKATIYTFSDHAKLVAPRRGMALRDALEASQPHSGTNLGQALTHVEAECRSGYDRLIVITDEQSHDNVPAPRGKGYVINVASNRNGVGYGAWNAHRRLERGGGGLHCRARDRAGRVIARSVNDTNNIGEQPNRFWIKGRSPILFCDDVVSRQPAAWCGTTILPLRRPRWETPGTATTG